MTTTTTASMTAATSVRWWREGLGGGLPGRGRRRGARQPGQLPGDVNPDQADSDGDGIGDVCDDDDGDGVLNPADLCPLVAGQASAQGCPDADGDGIRDDDGSDNCPLIANAGQAELRRRLPGRCLRPGRRRRRCGSTAPTTACCSPTRTRPTRTATRWATPATRTTTATGCSTGPTCARWWPDRLRRSGCPDADGDGIRDDDGSDNCPLVGNAGQANFDGDSLGDACDPDADGDGVARCHRQLPAARQRRPGQHRRRRAGRCLRSRTTTATGCSTGPTCARWWRGRLRPSGCPDADGDGIRDDDGSDNCPLVGNAGQENFDGDSLGDACDPDADGDGVDDSTDNCLLLSNTDQTNTDGDAQGDACDPDDDGDGVLDGADLCPLVAGQARRAAARTRTATASATTTARQLPAGRQRGSGQLRRRLPGRCLRPGRRQRRCARRHR